MRTPFEHIHLRVPPEQKVRLEAEALRRDVSVNALISGFISDALGGPQADSPRGRRTRKVAAQT